MRNPDDPPLTNTQKMRRWRRRNELFDKSVNGKRERKRFAEVTKDAKSPADAVDKYLLAALADVAQSLVVKALGAGQSSVSASRLILQLVGTGKSRSEFQGAVKRIAGEDEESDPEEIRRIAQEIR